MAFTPSPGSAGRVTSLAITPVLTTPLVTFAGTLVTLAEIFDWRATIQMAGEPPTSLTFESPANAEGVLFPEAIRGGTATWSVTLQGIYDIATPFTESRLRIGQFIYFSLYAFKATPVGYPNLKGEVIRSSPGTQVQAKHMDFTIEIGGRSVWPDFGTITP